MPGSQELLIIALVALFVLGPERLPGLARSAARGLTKLRNYGVTASKELRGVADLGEIEREVSDLRRELARTRADLRRAMRDTVASSPSSSTAARTPTPAGEDPVAETLMESTQDGDDTTRRDTDTDAGADAGADTGAGTGAGTDADTSPSPSPGTDIDAGTDEAGVADRGDDAPSSRGA